MATPKKTTTKKKPVAVKAAPVPPPPLSLREVKQDLEAEVRDFRDYILNKFGSFDGRDLRQHIAWYFEQTGVGVNRMLEQEKRNERSRLIAERIAKEATQA